MLLLRDLVVAAQSGCYDISMHLLEDLGLWPMPQLVISLTVSSFGSSSAWGQLCPPAPA